MSVPLRVNTRLPPKEEDGLKTVNATSEFDRAGGLRHRRNVVARVRPNPLDGEEGGGTCGG